MDHAAAAAAFNADVARTDWHDDALWFVREKRDRAAELVPDWEELRERASAIKEHALSHLDEYLVAVRGERDGERDAGALGARRGRAQSHRPRDPRPTPARRQLVKSKSMLTEECGLNPYLEARGIEVVDTDLGERIVQLRGEGPSHIVMPAIHLKKEEVGETFHEHLGTPAGLADPIALAGAAREHLRAALPRRRLHAHGNELRHRRDGRLRRLHERGERRSRHGARADAHRVGGDREGDPARRGSARVPAAARAQRDGAGGDGVHARTCTARARGRRCTSCSWTTGARAQLAREEFWRSLKCIRCGACMNTCPIYRRSGGHSYGSTVPGPIGIAC